MTPDPLKGTLHIVATPIGNPADIGQRARDVLERADVIAAEDTRIARTLLSHLAIPVRGRLRSLFESNERERIPSLLSELDGGRDVALISDAGTPLISDPGYRLVCAVIDASLPLSVVPGPSAVLAALVLSGLPPDRFLFCGFLPRKDSKRRAAIEALRTQQATLVFYEAPHRIAATLRDLADGLGTRRAALLRQVTKSEEDVQRADLAELAERTQGARVHGELTLVVEGAKETPSTRSEASTLLAALARQGLSARNARDVAHEVLGGDRRALYREAVKAIEAHAKPAS